MIRINLLPAEIGEAQSSQTSPLLPLAAAVIVPILVLIPLHLSKVAQRKKLEAEKVSLKNELDRYQPIIAQVEALEKAKVQLTQRKSVIQQLESERLRYPQFMDDFVKLLPGNLWLTSLTTVLQPSGNIMNVGMDVVALDNYAIADLIANLETSQIFTDVDLGTITASQSVTGQSINFHINALYRKMNPLPDANKKS